MAVTTSGADQNALEGMHAQVVDTYRHVPANWLVDGGYVSQDGIEAVTEAGSDLHAPLGTLLAKRDSAALIRGSRKTSQPRSPNLPSAAHTVRWRVAARHRTATQAGGWAQPASAR
ncbi:MAG: hypothetical protein P4L71_14750 [Acetobacteraceae bacterium]|nr:hypothetical protein [Acetobacteraceae bacterium]